MRYVLGAGVVMVALAAGGYAFHDIDTPRADLRENQSCHQRCSAPLSQLETHPRQ
jgi:hypothetical protein